MADELVISGGGSFAVATDELFAAAQNLRRLAAEAASIAAELALIDHRISEQWLYQRGVPAAALVAERSLDRARQGAGMIEAPAMALHHALSTAIHGYGFADAVVEEVFQGLAAGAAGLLGNAPWLLGFALPLLPGMGAATAGGFLGLSLREGSALAALNTVLSDPAFVSMVRLLVSSVDEAALGALGVPWPLTGTLGGEGLGMVQLGTVAGGVLATGSALGLTRETRVQLANEPRPRVLPAGVQGFEERIERIPEPKKDDGVQVVIDKHSTDGQPDRFEVYISGTETFHVGATTEPWDSTSNLGNAAGDESASVRAVREAMRLAGVTADTPVLLTGYSQGGATAAILAASGDYDVRGVLSVGGNTGQVPIPADIPTVLVEHTDDLVPAAGGVQRNEHAILVERQAMAGRELPEDKVVPAHHLEFYQETAQLMDAARSDQLTGAAAAFDGFGYGGEVTRTEYSFERVRGPERVAGGGGGGGGL